MKLQRELEEAFDRLIKGEAAHVILIGFDKDLVPLVVSDLEERAFRACCAAIAQVAPSTIDVAVSGVTKKPGEPS